MPKTSSAASQAVEAKEERGVDRSDRAEDVRTVNHPVTRFFLPPSYRTGQKEAMLEIERAFKTYDYVILEAPTGAGKSQIAFPFARKYSNSYILTVQKILQDQYKQDFENYVFIMKGKSEYVCHRNHQTCNKGWCELQKRRAEKCPDCPYRTAKQAAQLADITAYNYDAFYYQGLGGMPKRPFMLIDECHNMENKLSNFVSFTISNRKRKFVKIPRYSTVAEYEEWLEQYLSTMKSRLSIIEDYSELDPQLSQERQQLEDMSRRIEIYFYYKEAKGVEYICEYTDHRMWQTVLFRPLFVGAFASSVFWNKAEKALLMSATIIDQGIFCESVGLDSSKVYFVRMESTFPVKNRPIHIKPVGSMSYKNINDTLPKVKDAVDKVLDYFPGIKGIVHTHSEKIATYLKEHCSNPRLTFNKDYQKVLDMLAEHKRKDGSFIVASGLREGLDLNEDLSRVQLLCKVPYPNMGDKWVKERMNRNADWYNYQTTLSFVQSLGRSVRSETDHAKTFVLDSDFNKYYAMSGKRMLPRYIKAALIWAKKKK